MNGAVASLWILVLPPHRRKDISLYVARFAALNLYQTVKFRTGFSIPYAALSVLVRQPC